MTEVSYHILPFSFGYIQTNYSYFAEYGTSMIIYGEWITESLFIILFGIGAGVASLTSAQDYLNYATVPVVLGTVPVPGVPQGTQSARLPWISVPDEFGGFLDISSTFFLN